MRSTRRLGLLGKCCWCGGAALLLAVLVGCPNTRTSDIEAFLREQFGDVSLSTNVTIRIINQTNLTEQLTMRINGIEETFVCDADRAICDFNLGICPDLIEAVKEQRLDDSGAFVGGRNFDSSDDFTFTRGEFNCGQFIIFRFTETSSEVLLL